MTEDQSQPKLSDVILAASVLHHLRSDAQWRAVFDKFFRALRPGGAIWVFDLIESPISQIQHKNCCFAAFGAVKNQTA